MGQYKLSKEQVESFHENGYLSNIKLLEEWQVDALNEELAAITDPEHSRNHLFSISFHFIPFHSISCIGSMAGDRRFSRCAM